MTALFVDGKAVEVINADRKCFVVLIRPHSMRNQAVRLAIKRGLKGAGFTAVDDTQKYGQAIGHLGRLFAGALKVGDAVQADVDEAPRTYPCSNFTSPRT